MMFNNPKVLHALLKHLTEQLIHYVDYQIESGAQVSSCALNSSQSYVIHNKKLCRGQFIQPRVQRGSLIPRCHHKNKCRFLFLVGNESGIAAQKLYLKMITLLQRALSET